MFALVTIPAQITVCKFDTAHFPTPCTQAAPSKLRRSSVTTDSYPEGMQQQQQQQQVQQLQEGLEAINQATKSSTLPTLNAELLSSSRRSSVLVPTPTRLSGSQSSSIDGRATLPAGATLPTGATVPAEATTNANTGNRGSVDRAAAAAANVGGSRIIAPTPPPPVTDKEPALGKRSGLGTGKIGGLNIRAALGEAIGAVLNPRR